ncbi:MAG: hypothetical protein NC355_01420 [Blautia sp.]|nr:hypothetical protein [Blautia sp.]
MKKGKRILAIIGILLLVSLYIITLICAITDNTGTMQVFFASVVATVMIPALIWVYTFIYRLIKDNHADPEKEEQDS